MGKLGDRIGLKTTFILGLLVFACVYTGMIFARELWVFYVLFAFYGTYAACTDGIGKGIVSNLCKKEDAAAALGTYAGFNSIATLIASSLAGIVWHTVSPEATFAMTSIAAFLVIVVLLRLRLPMR